MQYFEINEPYYALLKAVDDEDATNKYIEVVAGSEEEFEEIHENMNSKDESYVWKKLAFLPNKESYPTVGDLKKAVTEEVTDILLIDGSLL